MYDCLLSFNIAANFLILRNDSARKTNTGNNRPVLLPATCLKHQTGIAGWHDYCKLNQNSTV